jgi:DNA-binding transcriptional ArsR family regulator/uncharacterized protein YndB with AHSA1/START domain
MSDADELTDVFKALGHPIRRNMLDILKNGPQTTGQLVEQFQTVTRFAIMKHLEILVQSNLVLVRRQGRSRLNFLNPVPLQQLMNRWVSRYEATFAGSLMDLKNFIENEKEEHNNMKDTQLEHSFFQIEQEVTIKASREKVFQALTEDIGKWWAFRLGGESSRFSFEPKVNGQFLETWGDHEGAVWGTIYYIKFPEEIRLNGHLGMRGAVNSCYTYVLEEREGATILKLSHTASGLIDPDWKESHAQGWKQLLGNFLKQYVEGQN